MKAGAFSAVGVNKDIPSTDNKENKHDGNETTVL